MSHNSEVEVYMELRLFVRATVALSTALAILACGNREVGTDPGNAALEVIVITPIAHAASVEIHGPVGSSHVTTTDTLRGLTPGVYDARAADVAASDSLVSFVLTGVVSGSPVTVEQAAMHSVTATYTVRGGSGAMWVGMWSSAHMVEGFTSQQLALAGAAVPADTLGAGGDSITISGVAFDSAGNLWATDYINQQILEFTPAQLASGESIPHVAIATSKEPWGIAFDARGNLWVSYYNGNDVREYAASDVQSWSGALMDPAPALTVTAPNGPLGIAFDHGGNLWVAGFDTAVTYKVASSVIASASSGGTVVPTDSLVSSYLDHSSGVAFDHSGNLWLSTESGWLVSYSAAQLALSSHGNPLFAEPGSGYHFDGIAFDNSGNLWASTESPDVAMFSPSQLAGSALAVPARTLIAGVGDASFALALGAHDSALPISPEFGSAVSEDAARRAPAPPARARDGSRPGTLRQR
ncbi:MAG: hypothetical protein ABI446_06610 [Gemmatimonadaceae bacterium]